MDRYYFSTVAYQGALGMDTGHLLKINEEFAPAPDILFLLRIPPRIWLERIAKRGDVANKFEREDSLAVCADIFDAIDRPFVLPIDTITGIKAIADQILWAVWEGPICDRLYRTVGPGPTLKPDKVQAFLAEAVRISRDDSIAVASKPDALVSLLGEFQG